MLPVLGIDQSLTATGVALYVDGVVLVDLIKWTVEPGIGGIRSGVRFHVGQVLKFAPKECMTVIEAPIIPRHGSGKALERAWLFGMLADQLMLRGPVASVHPSTRALYATGNGHADKTEVTAAMKAAYPGVHVEDDNVADALALMGMGARWLGEPIDGSITSKQAKAMRTAHWPEITKGTKR